MKKVIIFCFIAFSTVLLYSQSFDFQISYRVDVITSKRKIDIFFICNVKNNSDSVLIYKEMKQKKDKPVISRRDSIRFEIDGYNPYEDPYNKDYKLINVFFVLNADTLNVFKDGLFFEEEIQRKINPNDSITTYFIIPYRPEQIKKLYLKYNRRFSTIQKFVEYLLKNGTLYNIQGDEIYKLKMPKDYKVYWNVWDEEYD